jgi:S-adenosylmethionine decarboxylase
MAKQKKILLNNFNNLSKKLDFSFFFVREAKTEEEKIKVNNYFNDKLNAENVTEILVKLTKDIGANVVGISKQNYDPVGESSVILISEGLVSNIDPVNNSQIYFHLDKSHVCSHSYPEFSSTKDISTYRIDFEISTCGNISPLLTINFLIEEMQKVGQLDIIDIDFIVRGFTRDNKDSKIYNDVRINNIAQYIDKKYLNAYETKNVNLEANRI